MHKTFCDRCGKETGRDYAPTELDTWPITGKEHNFVRKDLCVPCADLIAYHFEHGVFGNVNMDVPHTAGHPTQDKDV